MKTTAERIAYTMRHFTRQGAVALERLGVMVLDNQGPTYRYTRDGQEHFGSMSDIFAIIDGAAAGTTGKTSPLPSTGRKPK